MIVKSVFHIKSFKDVNFWVEQSVLHLACKDISIILLVYQQKLLLVAFCKGGNCNFNIHSGRGSAVSSAKQGKSGSIYNLVKK